MDIVRKIKLIKSESSWRDKWYTY